MENWKSSLLALVDRVASTYTIGVNTAKFIHILLAIALCFGQLVSNVHAVGHFHEPEVDCANSANLNSHSESLNQHCRGDLPDLAGHLSVTDLHDGHLHHTQPLPDGANGVDNNCAIYHALLGLNCVFFTAQSTPVEPFEPTPRSHYVFAPSISDALEHQHIRAPPAVI